MAHEIFGERFVSRGEPAWHRLGHVVHDPLSAVAGLDLVGDYGVSPEPVYRKLADGTFAPLPYRLLVRDATADAEEETWNIVSEDYALLTPREFARTWDEHVAQPVETLGALRSGRQVFITTKLPSFSVAGDELENYLVALNGTDGSHGAKLMVSQVRVVCANTLRAAEGLASETYVMQHTPGMQARFAGWMRNVYEGAEAKTATIREAYEVLAARKVSKQDLRFVTEITYPFLRVPPAEVPLSDEQREKIAYRNTLEQRNRDAVAELLDGRGRGLDTPAAKGTLWGVYNAICELEDYRRGSDESAGTALLTGYRAATKERSFSACMQVVAKG